LLVWKRTKTWKSSPNTCCKISTKIFCDWHCLVKPYQ